MRKLAECLSDERGTAEVRFGLAAGAVAATMIFATRLVSDDLAEMLFSISTGF